MNPEDLAFEIMYGGGPVSEFYWKECRCGNCQHFPGAEKNCSYIPDAWLRHGNSRFVQSAEQYSCPFVIFVKTHPLAKAINPASLQYRIEIERAFG